MKRQKGHLIYYELLNNIFKDITLCLGGIFLLHKTDDRLVWEIANSIEEIYYRSMDRLESITGSGIIFDLDNGNKDLHPHPAIENLLKTIHLKPGKVKFK